MLARFLVVVPWSHISTSWGRGMYCSVGWTHNEYLCSSWGSSHVGGKSWGEGYRFSYWHFSQEARP